MWVSLQEDELGVLTFDDVMQIKDTPQLVIYKLRPKQIDLAFEYNPFQFAKYKPYIQLSDDEEEDKKSDEEEPPVESDDDADQSEDDGEVSDPVDDPSQDLKVAEEVPGEEPEETKHAIFSLDQLKSQI